MYTKNINNDVDDFFVSLHLRVIQYRKVRVILMEVDKTGLCEQRKLGVHRREIIPMNTINN